MTNAVYNAQCQYMGSGSTACSSSSVVSKSYCAEHVWLVYKEGSNILRRKDNKRYNFLSQLVSDFNSVAEELEAEGWTPEWDGSVDQRR